MKRRVTKECNVFRLHMSTLGKHTVGLLLARFLLSDRGTGIIITTTTELREISLE